MTHQQAEKAWDQAAYKAVYRWQGIRRYAFGKGRSRVSRSAWLGFVRTAIAVEMSCVEVLLHLRLASGR